MQHLDEGTIHAWLDGELPFDESSRVAAHAEVCDKCTALIAEARGFLAASSRILNNLDDVPGDVIPSGHAAATSPGGKTLTPRELGIVLPVGRTSGPRRWIPSRFAAAAAITVLAVGTYAIVNRSNAPMVSEIAIPTADGVRRAEVDLKDSAALSAGNERATQPVDATAPRAAAAPVPTVPPPGRTPSPPTVAKRDDSAPPVAREADARGKDAVAAPPTLAATSTERRTPPPVGQIAAAPMRATADAALKKPETVADAAVRDTTRFLAREMARPLPLEDSGARARQANQAKTLAIPPESVITSERRRLLGESQSRLQEVVVTGAASNAERREAAKALPELTSGKSLTLRSAPGCYDIMRGDAEMRAGVPPSVRLATSQIRVGKRALRLAVPQGLAAAGRDVRWYWSLGDGRIVLHKVAGGVVEFEGPIVAVRRTC